MAKVVRRSGKDVTVEVTMRLSGSLMEMEAAILEATNAVGRCATEEALGRFDTDGSPIRVGETKLSEEARRVLEQASEALGEYPDEPLVIEGHTDAVGSEEANLDLSRRQVRIRLPLGALPHGPPDQHHVLGRALHDHAGVLPGISANPLRIHKRLSVVSGALAVAVIRALDDRFGLELSDEQYQELLDDIYEMIDEIDEDDLEFLKKGVGYNVKLAEHGLKYGSGLGIGKATAIALALAAASVAASKRRRPVSPRA